jgi:hypothetical protein
MTEEERQQYRTKLISYYVNKQEYKDEQAVRRQVVNMDDVRLIEDYNRVFGN